MSEEKQTGFFSRAVARTGSSAVIWAWATTVARLAGNLAVLKYALSRLSPSEYGLWTGLFGIVNLATCIELGFSLTLGRFASFYVAGASDVPRLGLDGVRVHGTAPNAAALRGLVAVAASLYRVLAGLFAVLAIVAVAVWHVEAKEHPLRNPAALITAAVFVAGSAYNLYHYYWPALLNGLNHVRRYYQFVLAGQLVGYAIALAGLRLGGGMLVLALSQIVMALTTRILSRRSVRETLAALPETPPKAMSWIEFWPMTWRTGAAQAASLSLLQMPLVIISSASLAEAGSYGIALQILLMLHGVSATWLATQCPKIGSLRARGELAEVRKIMWHRTPLALGTFVAAVLLIPFVAPVAMRFIASKTPFVTPALWYLMAASVGLDLFVGLHAALIQTGNRTTHITGFVVTGIFGNVAALVAAHFSGTTAMLCALIASVLVFNAWWIPLAAWREIIPQPNMQRN
jgi:hypothetical protein